MDRKDDRSVGRLCGPGVDLELGNKSVAMKAHFGALHVCQASINIVLLRFSVNHRVKKGYGIWGFIFRSLKSRQTSLVPMAGNALGQAVRHG
eukprot:COSAG02_NODE_21800_length_774_cov_2.029630_1_plen_92_part_00